MFEFQAEDIKKSLFPNPNHPAKLEEDDPVEMKVTQGTRFKKMFLDDLNV